MSFTTYELLKQLQETREKERTGGRQGWRTMWMLLSPNKVFCLEPRPLLDDPSTGCGAWRLSA